MTSVSKAVNNNSSSSNSSSSNSSSRNSNKLVITNSHQPYQYEIKQLLGQGTYGATFAAIATNTDSGVVTDVAIKFLFPTNSLTDEIANEEIAGYVKVANIAEEEGITTISCPVNVLCFHDVDAISWRNTAKHQPVFKLLQSVIRSGQKLNPSKPIIYIVTDYLEGDDLATLIKQNDIKNLSPTEDELKKFLYDIITAFKYLESKGISHRDIKPENIIRTRTGRYVVIDFGLICNSSQCSAATTPGYGPNEQAILYALNEDMPFVMAIAGDIFALGRTLTEYALSRRILNVVKINGVDVFKVTDIPALDSSYYPIISAIANQLLLDYNYIAIDPEGYNKLLSRLGARN